jgi:nucleoside permease NupC
MRYRENHPAMMGSMVTLPAAMVTVTLIAPATTNSEHWDARGRRGREKRRSMREIGKSAITANHTIVNIWDTTIRFAPVLAYISALNAMNEKTVT